MSEPVIENGNYMKEQGIKEGEKAGKKKGKREGKREGENLLGKLILALQSAGRSEDITKAASDSRYRNKLYKEFGLSL